MAKVELTIKTKRISGLEIGGERRPPYLWVTVINESKRRFHLGGICLVVENEKPQSVGVDLVSYALDSRKFAFPIILERDTLPLEFTIDLEEEEHARSMMSEAAAVANRMKREGFDSFVSMR